MARVGALVPDLLFGSRVKGALEAAGHQVDLFDQEDTARSRAPECDVLIVDLGSADVDGATLVESMLMGRELGATRTLGFYPHVEAATRARALQAGFDLVVPRSRMARDGAALVEELTAGRDD